MTDTTDEQRVRRAVELADAAPADVALQIDAAYACDRYGDESDAVRYYDAAWRLGVPVARRREFLVGYGSTLRNVARLDESIEILRGAVAEFGGFAPLRAFLSLSLHSAGRHAEAMQEALSAILDAAGDGSALGGYDRALRYYRDELGR